MMFFSIPDRYANFSRTKNSVIAQNVVFDVAPHGIASAENELLNIEKRIGRELGIETKHQKIICIPQPSHVLALTKPVEKFRVRFHPRICRAEGVDPHIKSGTKREYVNLTTIHEFLGETQSEIGCHTIHRTW